MPLALHNWRCELKRTKPELMQEIETLEKSFERLSTEEENQPRLNKMDILSMVPQFDGNKQELPLFLKTAEMAMATTKQEDKEIALMMIIGKLNGKARNVVCTNLPNTWEQLKQMLKERFADTRNEACLLRDIAVAKQGQNEGYRHFYERISELLSIANTYIEDNESEPARMVKKSMFDDLAFKTFLAGIKEPMGSRVRCMRPENITQAWNFLQEEINIKNLQKQELPYRNNFQSRSNYQENAYKRVQRDNPNNTQNRNFYRSTNQTQQRNFEQQNRNYIPQPMSTSTNRSRAFESMSAQTIRQNNVEAEDFQKDIYQNDSI